MTTVLLLLFTAIYLLVSARPPSQDDATRVFSRVVAPGECVGRSTATTCFDLTLRNDGQQTIQLRCILGSPQKGVRYVFETDEKVFDLGDMVPDQVRVVGIFATRTDPSITEVEAPAVICE